MDDHDLAVTEQYLTAENALDDAWYDEVHREEVYFENEDTPLQSKNGFSESGNFGRVVGEVDVWLLDREQKLMYAVEVKTSWKDAGYGQDQLDRLDDHFDDWDVIKKLLVK